MDAAKTLEEHGIEGVHALYAAMEIGWTQMFEGFEKPFEITGVSTRTEVIKGVDGNDVTLYISTPAGPGPFPCMLHTHGGGMALMQADNDFYCYWRDRCAMAGFVVVGVEFRNITGALGPYEFPAGLNDCFSGLEWVNGNKASVEIRKPPSYRESARGH